jgi:serine/threonine-protein kinase RsbW
MTPREDRADQLTVLGDARSVPEARRKVRELVRPFGDDLGATAELLTDELVTNAVRHAGNGFFLDAGISGGRLRVTVTDPSVSAPITVYDAGHDLDHGRGLTIVAALSSDWGIERCRTYKRVWFTLDIAS